MSEANGVLRNHYHPLGATIYIKKRLTNQSYRLFSQPHLTVARSDCFQNGNSRVDKAKEVLGIELENPEFEYVPKRNKFDRVKSFWL